MAEIHLLEIFARRQVPAAGVYLMLTRRCPLSCAHCSTDSSLLSEQYEASNFLRIVDSFTPTDHPEIMILTGGEPFLRPKLVRELTERAHAVGTRVVAGSGMFFARHSPVPPAIDKAIAGLDHLTASLDTFHEREVPRAEVLRVLRTLVDRGQAVSVSLTGLNAEDPYLLEASNEIREVLEDRVPVSVSLLHSVGRAKAWLRPTSVPANELDKGPVPCRVATWPVISYDGTAVACCNPPEYGLVPSHLRLGHSAADGWPAIRDRCKSSAMMRAIRTFGPIYITDKFGSGAISCDGYCSTCHRISSDPVIAERVESFMARPTTRAIEDQVEIMRRNVFVDTPGPARYAHLLRLGYASN